MSAVVSDKRRVAIPTHRRPPSWSASLRAVLRRGLLDHARGVLTWGISLGAFGAFMAAIYPSVQSTVQDVAKNYPEGLKQAFGVQAMNTVEGYVHAELFSLIVPLAIGFFAIRLAAEPVSVEENGRLDTILALPIPRRVLIIGSYLVMAIAVTVIMAMTGVLTFAAGRLAGTHISAGLVTAGVTGVVPLALFFGGVSALAAGALHSSRRVTGLSLAVLLGMYALDLAGRMASGLAPARWASAFRYYGAPMRDGIDPAAFIGLAAAGAILLLVGAVAFERRDILH